MTPFLALVAVLPSAQWTPLFDGSSLQGWRQLGGKANYSVQDKAIVGSSVAGSPNSFLCTEKTYADFELELEAWVDPKLNSGIQFRSMSVPGYQDGRVHGYQCEVDATNPSKVGGVYDEARRGWLQDISSNPKASAAFKPGQWNKFRVVAKGDLLQTWVNGVQCASVNDKLTQSGFIAMQVHTNEKDGVQVKWRNVRIKDNGNPTLTPRKGGRWLLRTQNDMKNWVKQGTTEPCPWNWMDGFLEDKPGSGTLQSTENFGSCRVHLEFMTDDNGKTGQANGNSGFYINGSYELQILNSAPRGPLINECGAIYNVKAPDYAMAFPAGVWQTYDIEFTAAKFNGNKKAEDAKFTIYHNGTMIHNNISVSGPTGAGMPESPDPKPFFVQDHGNKIRVRNIWVLPLPAK